MELDWFTLLMAGVWELLRFPISILGYDTSPFMLMLFLLILSIVTNFIVRILGMKEGADE